MSIDQNRNNYWDTWTRLKDYFKNVKINTHQEEVISIIEISSQRRKELLESELEKWKLIQNEKEFTSWVHLLRINNIIDIKSSFGEMNDNDGPFIIQRNQYLSIYNHPFVVFYQHPNPKKWNNGRIGFIDTQWKFISNKDRNHIITFIPSLKTPIRNTTPLASTTRTISSWKIDTVSPTVEVTPENNNIHTIKKWEFLWKIISEKYWLNSEKDKNVIWQIMEIIRKDTRNKKAIKDIDTIFIWEKLYLPTDVKLSQWKWKPEREIKIVKQEAK